MNSWHQTHVTSLIASANFLMKTDSPVKCLLPEMATVRQVWTLLVLPSYTPCSHCPEHRAHRKHYFLSPLCGGWSIQTVHKQVMNGCTGIFVSLIRDVGLFGSFEKGSLCKVIAVETKERRGVTITERTRLLTSSTALLLSRRAKIVKNYQRCFS